MQLLLFYIQFPTTSAEIAARHDDENIEGFPHNPPTWLRKL
ncbi:MULTISPECIES: hypothetical protein [unclassified Pseudoalteromonas]|nr:MULTISPECIES: hypothetical protein [unclassified Pseudoalteromonas]